jgi:hypothetical protein
MKSKSPPGAGRKKAGQSRHLSSTHKNIMDKVKIKRVKRNKKKTTAKEKILAGLGVGGALMGGVGAVSPKPSQTQFVRTQSQSESSKSSGVKSVLKKIFGATIGVQEAKASGGTVTVDANGRVYDENGNDITDTLPTADLSIARGHVPGVTQLSTGEEVISSASSGGTLTAPTSPSYIPSALSGETASPGIQTPPSVTSNIPSLATVGDSWTITVAGPVGAEIRVLDGKGNNTSMGTIGFGGTTIIPGTFSSSDVGSWNETWTVGGGIAGNISFEVVEASPQTGTTSTTGEITAGSPLRTTITDSQMLSDAAIMPFDQMSPGEQSMFTTHFSSGQNQSDVPSSFGASSAFAYALGLGNTPGLDSDQGKKLAANGLWYQLDGGNWIQTTAPVQVTSSSNAPAENDTRVLTTAQGDSIHQTYHSGVWLNTPQEGDILVDVRATGTVSSVYRDGQWTPESPRPSIESQLASGTSVDNRGEAGAGTNQRGTLPVTTTIEQIAPSVTSNIPANPKVGDSWSVTVKGTQGAAVSVNDGKGNITTMGTIDDNGTKILTGTFGPGDVGSWNETWMVGGAVAGNISFTVNPAPESSTYTVTPGQFSQVWSTQGLTEAYQSAERPATVQVATDAAGNKSYTFSFKDDAGKTVTKTFSSIQELNSFLQNSWTTSDAFLALSANDKAVFAAAINAQLQLPEIGQGVSFGNFNKLPEASSSSSITLTYTAAGGQTVSATNPISIDYLSTLQDAQFFQQMFPGSTIQQDPWPGENMPNVVATRNIDPNDPRQIYVLVLPSGQRLNVGQLMGEYNRSGLTGGFAKEPGISLSAAQTIAGQTQVTGSTINSTPTSITFVNLTSGNTTSLQVGDSWKMTITGPGGKHVYASTNGGSVLDRGIISNGSLILSGNISAEDAKQKIWNETWYVGDSAATAVRIGSINFTISQPAPVATTAGAPALSFANANGALTLGKGNTWVIDIKNAAPGAPVYAVGGRNSQAGTQFLGMTDGSGNFHQESAPLTEGEVGDWSVTVFVGKTGDSQTENPDIAGLTQVGNQLKFTVAATQVSAPANISSFTPAFKNNMVETGPDSTTPLNPQYFLDDTSASQLAVLVGGRVVSQPVWIVGPDSPYQVPNANFIVMPDGTTVNAGQLATMMLHGYPASMVDTELYNSLGQTYLNSTANQQLNTLAQRQLNDLGYKDTYNTVTMANALAKAATATTTTAAKSATSNSSSIVIAGPTVNSVATSLVFKNLTVSDTKVLAVGDRWEIDITGPENANVYVTGGKNGAQITTPMGTVKNGKLVLSGITSSADIGTWNETWKVGSTAETATVIGSFGFTVVASRSTSAIIEAPVISALSSPTLVAGAPLVILGSNFNLNAADNIVEFLNGNTVVASVTAISATATSLTVVVPALGPGNYGIRVRSASDPSKVSNTFYGVVNSVGSGTTGGNSGTTSGTGVNSKNTESLNGQGSGVAAEVATTGSTGNGATGSGSGSGGSSAGNGSSIGGGYSSGSGWTYGGGSVAGASVFQGLKMPAGYPASEGGLKMPSGYPASEGYVAESQTSQGQNSTYTVKKGDTLWSIAKKYYGDGKKWRKILEANTAQVRDPKGLKIGTQLVIPKL